MEANRTSNRSVVRSRTTRFDQSSSTLHLGTLEQRLHDGYERIEQALARGEDVTAWEEFWIELLRQYEEASSPYLEAA